MTSEDRTEKLHTARLVGVAAFKADKERDPFMDFQGLNPLVTDTADHNWHAELRTAWLEGWDSANISDKAYTVIVETLMSFNVPVTAGNKGEAKRKAEKLIEKDDCGYEVEESTITATWAAAEGEEAPPEPDTRPRVFITVQGGVAYIQATDNVDVAVLDYDVDEDNDGNPVEDDEARLAKVPEHFRSLPDVQGERY